MVVIVVVLAYVLKMMAADRCDSALFDSQNSTRFKNGDYSRTNKTEKRNILFLKYIFMYKMKDVIRKQRRHALYVFFTQNVKILLIFDDTFYDVLWCVCVKWARAHTAGSMTSHCWFSGIFPMLAWIYHRWKRKHFDDLIFVCVKGDLLNICDSIKTRGILGTYNFHAC